MRLQKLQEGRQLNEAMAERTLQAALQAIRARLQDSKFESDAGPGKKPTQDELENHYTRLVNQANSNLKEINRYNLPNGWKAYLANVSKDILYRNSAIRELQNRVKAKSNPVILFRSAIRGFEHFAGIPYEPIRNVNPMDNYEDPTAQMRPLEKKWQDSIGPEGTTFEPEDTEDFEIALDLGKFKWINLNREECRQEANSMGHCGNSAPREGDTILSLRKVQRVDDKNLHTPVLTFILNNGILGEMKGRANEKPAKRYHPYIVSLLKAPFIKGLGGGGYAPENNFHPDDLTDEQRAAIIKVKGEDFLEVSPIVRIRELYKQFVENKTNTNRQRLYTAADDLLYEFYEESGTGMSTNDFGLTLTTPVGSDGKVTKDSLNARVIAADVEGIKNFRSVGKLKAINDHEFFDIEVPSDAYDIENSLTGDEFDEVVRKIRRIYDTEVEEYFNVNFKDKDDFEDDDAVDEFITDNMREIITYDIAGDLQMAVNFAYIAAVERATADEALKEANSDIRYLLRNLGLDDSLGYYQLSENGYTVPIPDENVLQFVKTMMDKLLSTLDDLYLEYEDNDGFEYEFDQGIFEEELPRNIDEYF